MDFFFIFLIFSTPLLVVSIIAFAQTQDTRKKWFNMSVFVINIFFSSIGPLVISMLLLRKSALPTLIAAVTMAGFVPAVVSILLWIVLLKESTRMITGVNSSVITLLNIGLPLTLALLSHNDLNQYIINIFSYEFLAMAIGASAGFAFSPLTRLMDKKYILLGILFLTAVLIGPGIYYEYQWLSWSTASRLSDLTVLSIIKLLIRYFGISSLSLFIFKRIKENI